MIRLLIGEPFDSLAMLAAGVLSGSYAIVQLTLAALASRWPTVDGEIVSAHVIQGGTDARGLNERITYRYSVGGKLFVNDRVRIGPQPQRASIVPATGYPVAADSVARRYPVGQRVSVRYNPRRPEESVLHAQPNFAVLVTLVGAAASLGFAARHLFGPR